MIIVEDGSLVADANSYASVSTLRQFALARNIQLKGTDEELQGGLMLAMDKLDTYRKSWTGRSRKGAELAWPRDNAWVDGEQYGNDRIPRELVKAQLLLAIQSDAGTALFANQTQDTQILKRKKIDVLEWEYATPEGDSAGYVSQPSFPEVDSLLGQLLDARMGSINSVSVRA